MIGLIVYSHTGHTAKVSEKLFSRLEGAGEVVEKVVLQPSGTFSMSAERVALGHLPAVDRFSKLVLGTPVHGGRMAAPMRTFLEDVPTLEGIQVVFLLTHFFPRQWGAVQTIEAMEALCQSKGAQVLGSADVAWLGLGRKRRIKRCVVQAESLLKTENMH